MAQELTNSLGITLGAVGVVRNSLKSIGRQRLEGVVSDIVMDPGWEKALDGVEDFSHLVVIYWMHRVAPEERLLTRIRPRRMPELPLVGVFASRSPARPNPLGLATVKLVERRGGTLRVMGLDAVDGSPVLDVKPYIPEIDAVDGALIPDWMRTLSFTGKAGEG